MFVARAGLVGPQDATTVPVRDGPCQVQDGPFAETREFLAGFAIIDVPDLDAPIEWAARYPSAAHSAIEVRPPAGAYFALGTAKVRCGRGWSRLSRCSIARRAGIDGAVPNFVTDSPAAALP